MAGIITAAEGFSSAVALTRPNDVLAYTANDVIGAATGSSAALTFTIGARGSLIRIISTSLLIEQTSVIAGQTSYTLHLYSITPPSALGDNVAWTMSAADAAVYLGSLSLGTPADIGSVLYIETNNINKQLVSSGASVYGYLVTAGAYTPQANTIHNIKIHTVSS